MRQNVDELARIAPGKQHPSNENTNGLLYFPKGTDLLVFSIFSAAFDAGGGGTQ